MAEQTLYYLPAQDLTWYDEALKGGYQRQYISFQAQKYVIFQLRNREEIAIAWPTVDGLLTGRINDGDTLFDTDWQLEEVLRPQVLNKKIKMILIPRYV